MKSTPARMVGILTILLIGSASVPSRAEDPPRSRAGERLVELMRSFDAPRSKQESLDYEAQLVAYADTMEATGELILAARALERAGMKAYGMSRIDDAIAIWARGLDVARRSGDPQRIGALLNARMVGRSASGDNVGALEEGMALLEVRRAAGDRRGEGTTWHNIAYSQIALFRFPEAIQSLRRALALHREAGNGFGVAASLQSLVTLLSGHEPPDLVLALADSAVIAAEKTGNPQMIGVALQSRAAVRHDAGLPTEALGDLERAQAILEPAGLERVAAPVAMARADVLVTLDRADEAVLAARAALGRVDVASDPAPPIIGRAILGRALLDRGDHAGARAVLEDSVRRWYAMQDTLHSELSQAEANRVAQGVGLLAALHLREGRTEEAWSTTESHLGRLLRQRIVADAAVAELASLQRWLAERDASALVYGIADRERCVAFRVDPDRIEGIELPVDGALREELRRLLGLMASGAEDVLCEPSLRSVASRLVHPLLDGLDPTRRRLVIMPGGFGSIPFETLPVDEVRTLGDRHAVSYAPSASVLLALEARTPARGAVVAWADPLPPASATMDENQLALRSRDLARTPLPQARREIAALPGDAELFLGERATAQTFVARASDATILHFATHAVVDPMNPAHSALILAPDEQGRVELTAARIEEIGLRADLVCMSGCTTVGGHHVIGEGTLGLARSFLVAGARTVVASWWDVEDGAARRFVELFYGGLRAGLERDEAAQRARARMREEGFVHRDRSAFSVIGASTGRLDPVLAQSSSVPRAVVVGGIVVVIVASVVARRFRRGEA